jgi:hypothetical protein
VTGVSETDFDDELDDGAHRQELKHEVVKRIKEQAPVRGHLGRCLEIGAEELLAHLEISGGQTLFLAGVQLLHERMGTYRLFNEYRMSTSEFLNIHHIFIVLSLTVTLDDVNQLLECYNNTLDSAGVSKIKDVVYFIFPANGKVYGP